MTQATSNNPSSSRSRRPVLCAQQHPRGAPTRLVMINREELINIMRRLEFEQDNRTFEKVYASSPETMREFTRMVFQSGIIHDN